MDNDSTAVANSADSSVAGVAPNTSPASGATSSGSDVVIETQNLSKVYKDFWGRKKVHALKSLDIEVRKG